MPPPLPPPHTRAPSGVVDSWDKLRQASSAALLHMASPLPGLDTAAQLACLLSWALALLDSPRMRESDAGGWLPGCSVSQLPGWRGWCEEVCGGDVGQMCGVM